jgi:hypothetical protein
MRCQLTQAYKADNNCQWMIQFFKGLKGKIFEDKRFASSNAYDQLYADGLKQITGIRNNIKKPMDGYIQEKWWFKKSR